MSHHAGLEDYESIRREMYRDSDVILICFDIGHPPSLQNVVNKVDLTYSELLRYFHLLRDTIITIFLHFGLSIETIQT